MLPALFFTYLTVSWIIFLLAYIYMRYQDRKTLLYYCSESDIADYAYGKTIPKFYLRRNHPSEVLTDGLYLLLKLLPFVNILLLGQLLISFIRSRLKDQ